MDIQPLKDWLVGKTVESVGVRNDIALSFTCITGTEETEDGPVQTRESFVFQLLSPSSFWREIQLHESLASEPVSDVNQVGDIVKVFTEGGSSTFLVRHTEEQDSPVNAFAVTLEEIASWDIVAGHWLSSESWEPPIEPEPEEEPVPEE